MNFEQFLSDLGQLISQFKDKALAILPDLIFALVVVLLGLLIARIIKSLIVRFINNLDRLVPGDKLRSRFEKNRLDRSAKVVGKIIYWIIVLFFATIATEILGLPIMTTWLSGLARYLPNILVAVIIVFFGIIAGKLVQDLIASAAKTAGIENVSVISNIGKYAVLFITVLIAVDQIGVDIAVLTDVINIILAGVLFGAALAFGLGAKTAVSNILASYYLQSWYKVGQSVRLNDISGQIIQITPTSVIIETSDGVVSVPAKQFSENISVLVNKKGSRL